MPHHHPRSRSRERGSAILVTLIFIVALLGGGATLVSMQLHSTKSSGVVRARISGTMCAEAGLAAARPLVIANYKSWNAALANGLEPSWLVALSHDPDGDGVADFTLKLVDNDDEAPATNNAAVDNDLQIYIVSTCIMNAETPITVSELVQFTPGSTCYQTQSGGCSGGGNNN